MDQTILDNEPTLRLGVFLGVLSAMALWELAVPRRRQEIPRLLRWSNNLALVALDTAIMRIAFPVLAVGFAALSQERGWGLFNLVEVPGWLAFLAAFLLLDLAIYAQHVVFHKTPVLWRFHRMHHADVDFDTTTGIRFHPIEIVLSMLYKLALVGALGAPPAAVLVFEIVLNATSLFNHGNVTLGRLDPLFRKLIVTPDMHRVHHSVWREEHDTNFGFNFSFWDRLFGTYLAQPAKGHDRMTIGLAHFRERREQWLDRLLWQPFKGEARLRKEKADSEDPASLGD
ncbi:sterol desaturase family protein [Altererythrobacter sp. MF3-039]|uniref:sterol desaturase family protein n=1 Tax=Altererythrobacter sp. MF3-039 TaxID=3252901 RepID=UPI00390C8674